MRNLTILFMLWYTPLIATHITFISSGFFSHFHTLQKAAITYAQENPQDTIQFITITFGSCIPPHNKIEELQKLNIRTKIISAKTTKNLNIALEHTQEIIDTIQGTELLVYDYYLVTGYLIGKILNIPTICSITGALGSFDTENIHYKELIADNTKTIYNIEKKFNIPIKSLLQHKDSSVFIPSDETNILYGYQNLVESREYNHGRNLKNPYFCIDQLPAIKQADFVIPHKQAHQKLIYVSFGTMFNKMSLPRKLIKQIFTWLIESFNNNPEYIFIVVNAGNIELPQTGSNFFVYDSFVPQTEILKHADLFITHAGAHSLNESLHAQVPMIAIPFFWDQHLAAKNIDELEIGKAFLHEPENQETAMFLKNQLVERPSLTKQKLSETIIEMVHNAELYKKNIEIIAQKQPGQLANIIKKVKGSL